MELPTAGPWIDRIGAAGRFVWKLLRPVIFLVGLVAIVGLVALFLFIAEVADFGANRIFTQARPPTDSELPHTATAIAYSSEDVQVLGGQGLGLSCSVPATVERFVFPPGPNHAPTSLRMRQACAFHDYCYRHGAATYGYGQADCDYLLMEHAYRICRFLNTANTVASCISEARKVALGVRVGGSDSFKRADDTPQSPTEGGARPCAVDATLRLMDDRCTSSYFEFDPYPVRAASYSVYRIADAPGSWAASGISGKALYVFRMRPSGTQVTIIGWTGDRTVCTGYSVPGDVAYLNVPPRIVRSGRDDSTGEDWFVWWRRRSLDQTGGKLAILSPRRASPEDWAELFAGAQRFDPTYCSVLHVDRSQTPASPHRAVRNFDLGEKTVPDDGEFSDILPAPGLSRGDGLLLMALRTQACSTPRRSCYHEIAIDPRNPEARITLDPYAIRDDVKNDRGRDPDRYRNYVTSPIPMAGPEGPALAWLRRGEDNGDTYGETALLRRAYRSGSRGESFGLVLLRELPESADPVFVLGRTSQRPRLHALMTGSNRQLILKEWWLPPPIAVGTQPSFESNGKCESNAPGGLFNGRAQATVCPRVIATACLRELDDTWLIKPPSVLGSSDGRGTVVFARFHARSHPTKPRVLSLAVEARVLQIAPDGDCKPGATSTFDLNMEVEADPEARDDTGSDEREKNDEGEEVKRARIASLRGRPILVARIADGKGYSLIVPDPRTPGQSIMVDLER
jgi:hypothetical protein